MFLKGSLVGTSFVLAGLSVLVLVDACSSSKLAGQGGECFVADDCAPGLVCIEQKDKSRICTNDLTLAAGTVPPDGAAPDAGDAGEGGTTGEGGTPPNDSGTTPPKDSGTTTPPKDSGTNPPPQDSGSPADTGTD